MGTLNPEQQSAGLSLGGGLLSAFGDVASGQAQAQQLNYRAQIAKNNAAIQQANASNALAAGNVAESTSKLQTGQAVARERAAQAANGFDVSVGANPATRESTQTVGAMEAANIHYNAARQAYGYSVEAANETAQAGADEQGAGNAEIGGFAKAATTLLGSASSVAAKYRQYQLGVNAPSYTNGEDLA